MSICSVENVFSSREPRSPADSLGCFSQQSLPFPGTEKLTSALKLGAGCVFPQGSGEEACAARGQKVSSSVFGHRARTGLLQARGLCERLLEESPACPGGLQGKTSRATCSCEANVIQGSLRRTRPRMLGQHQRSMWSQACVQFFRTFTPARLSSIQPPFTHYARLHPYKLLRYRLRATWRQRHASTRISSKHATRSWATPGTALAHPSAVWPSARWLATDKMFHQRLAHATWAAAQQVGPGKRAA